MKLSERTLLVRDNILSFGAPAVSGSGFVGFFYGIAKDSEAITWISFTVTVVFLVAIMIMTEMTRLEQT